MKRVKACLNSECSECKKTYYKATDEFCVKCGSKLSYVCKHKNFAVFAVCYYCRNEFSAFENFVFPVHLAGIPFSLR